MATRLATSQKYLYARNYERRVDCEFRSNITDQNHYGKLRTESRQLAASRVIPMDRFRSLSVSRSLLRGGRRTKKKKKRKPASHDSLSRELLLPADGDVSRLYRISRRIVPRFGRNFPRFTTVKV